MKKCNFIINEWIFFKKSINIYVFLLNLNNLLHDEKEKWSKIFFLKFKNPPSILKYSVMMFILMKLPMGLLSFTKKKVKERNREVV